MEKQNIELVNQILNEVGQYIVGTVGQYSLEWDYACFVSFSSPDHPHGEFHLFHKKNPISFKSSQLVYILFELFEDYKKAINVYDKDCSVKYAIRNADLKVDIKLDHINKNVWSSDKSPDVQNPFNFLVGDIFEAN